MPLAPAAYLARNPVWLAPMAGVNDAAFRVLCKRAGAGLTFSEMVSAKGLHYGGEHNNSHALLQLLPEEEPAVVQLFGREPALMAEQAVAVAELLGDRLAFIDVNMGCPVPKVVNKGEGSALMKEPEHAAEIIAAMAFALAPLGQHVTVKFRRGWDTESENYLEFGKLMEDAGAAALTIHGRYRSQHYRGNSLPEAAALLKEQVAIPVIASGDLLDTDSVLSALTVADGVMIARGARGNPWIFSQVAACLAGQTPAEVSFEDRFNLMLEHATLIEQTFGPRALVRMRKHVMWYCAGLPGASYFRSSIQHLSTMDDLRKLISEYRAYLLQRGLL